MNKGITLLVLVSFPLLIVGQITDIKVSDNLKLDRVYLGLVSNTSVKTTDAENENSGSLQSGLMLTYSLNESLKIRSFGVTKSESDQQTKVFTSYEVIYDIFEKIDWHVGVMSTPTTELRPNPTTWESQTETNAQSKIIGGRTGTKINFKFSSNLIISYGFFNHNSVWTNHLKLHYKFIKIAGFIAQNNTFLVLDINTKRINSTIIVEPNYQFSKSMFINFNRGLSLLVELEYSMITEKINYGNVGLRKYYTSNGKSLKGFFSIGYSPNPTNQVTGSFAIHI